MNIIEVKNNLVKLCYEEDLELSSLVLIKDTHKSYIAQVLYLEATRVGKIAVAKLIFNYENGIHAYDGSIPTLRAEIEKFDTSVLLNTLEHSNPLTLGKIAGKKDNIVVDFNILKDNPIIMAEKFFITKVLLNNLALQIQARKGKIVVFDTTGIFKSNKLTVTKDFRLPLNDSTINYIYEKGFEDATAESKAMIQAIFEDLSEYSKTVEFIPFDTFKAVIDSEFMRTKLMQLVILKNKIKQIKDQHIFAQQESEFKVLQEKFETESTVVLDISCLQESLQQECIKYVYSVLKKLGSEFYAFTPVTNENSDKFLLQQILDTENVHTTMICGYDYAYLNDLKKRSKNMLMFTPLKQQKDFGGYNIFLHRLAEDEFIAYGKMTKFVPLIAKLFQMTKSDAYIPSIITNQIKTDVEQSTVAPVPPVQTTEPTIQVTPTEETALPNVAPVEEVHTEETAPAEPEAVQISTELVVEPQPTPTEPVASETTPVQPAAEQIVDPAQPVTPQPTQEVPQELSQEAQIAQMAGATAESVQPVAEAPTEPTPQVQTPTVEETPTPAPQAVQPQPTPTVEPVPQVQEPQPAEEIIAPQEPAPQPAEVPIAEEPAQPVEESAPAQAQNAPSDEVQEALDSVPDIEDEEELSDDDLDMIEELSKPDEEISAINQEQPQQAQEIPDYEPQAQAPQQQQPRPQPQPQRQVPPPPQGQQQIPQPTPQPLEMKEKPAQNVPEYSAAIPDEDKVNSDALQQGDRVFHQEFGEGVVEKMINYGDKVLCSVNFTNVGRRLLNPEISEMKKI